MFLEDYQECAMADRLVSTSVAALLGSKRSAYRGAEATGHRARS